MLATQPEDYTLNYPIPAPHLPRKRWLALAISTAIAASSSSAYAVNPSACSVNVNTDDGTGDTTATLSWAIFQANQGLCVDNIINLQTDVTITGVMKRLIKSDLTLQSDPLAGDTYTISGEGSYRPLFVKSGTVTIKNLTLANGKAKGGDGSGGGAGLGGALFVYDGTVSVENVAFNNNNATGGNAPADNYGGGGGMFGNGGGTDYSGGGGLFGNGSEINGYLGGNGGYGGLGGYGGSAGIGSASLGSETGGGGTNGDFGGGGGGGNYGGNGGFGGGGGAGAYNGGRLGSNIGGFGGGGGGGGSYGGNGGFGGGGGRSHNFGGSGTSGYGGGTIINRAWGGGGAGFGGAIFAMKGTTTLKDVSFNDNAVIAGIGYSVSTSIANMGAAKGADVFICNSELSSSCAATVNFCGTTTITEPAATSLIGTPGSTCPSGNFTITGVANPTEGGAVICAPDSVSSGGGSTCTATPSSGYTFNNWSGACTGTGGCDLTNITANTSVTGTFIQTFTISSSATEGGTVSCTPNPVNSGGSVVCVATPTNANYIFDGWEGDDCEGITPHCTIPNVTSNKTARGKFSLVSVETPSPSGNGSVTVGLKSVNSLGIPGTGAYLSDVSLEEAPSANQPAGFAFPLGLSAFTVHSTGTVEITVTYPDTIPAGAKYWKVDSNGIYTAYPATISGNTVTFRLTDNGAGDEDPTVGVIRDPSGLGLAVTRGDGSDSGSGGGGSTDLWGLLGLLPLLLLRRFRQQRQRGHSA